MNLSENCKVVLAKAAQEAGVSAVTTDVIDMAGYREIVFVGSIATKNAGNYANLQEDDVAAGSSLADLAGTKIASNEQYFKIGLVRPKKRYVALKITRGASTATGDVWAFLFNARKAPIASATTALKEETHMSPAAGTA